MKKISKEKFLKSSKNGAWSAFVLSVLYIIGSVVIIVLNYDNWVIIPLIISTAVLTWYVLERLLPKHFLSNNLLDIDSSIEKFVKYMKRREKIESLVLGAWIITLVPFILIYIGYEVKTIVKLASTIGLVFLIGQGFFMAFNKQYTSLIKSHNNE